MESFGDMYYLQMFQNILKFINFNCFHFKILNRLIGMSGMSGISCLQLQIYLFKII